MSWLRQLPERRRRGSWPRCVLMMEGSLEEVASRLTRLVDLPDVVVSPDDKWMPCGKPLKRADGKWDTKPTDEVQFGNPKKRTTSCNLRFTGNSRIGGWQSTKE